MNNQQKNFVPLSQVLDESMRNPAFAKLWNDRANHRAIVQELIELRIARKLSQRQLADKVGIKQPALARIERGKTLPSLTMLTRLATGMGKRLEIRFV